MRLHPLHMMYNPYIMKRTQIYLEEDQASRLSHLARSRGTTSSKMIREAVDTYLADEPAGDDWLTRQRSAVEATFASIPRLPDGLTYVRVSRARDAERLEDLERRWRHR